MNDVIRFAGALNRSGIGPLNAISAQMRQEIGMNPSHERVVSVAAKYGFRFSVADYAQALEHEPTLNAFSWYTAGTAP
jgi:hypothetical protein